MKKDARPPIDNPVFRPLQVFAFDPGHGRALGNHMTVEVPWEPLQPGPVGRRIAVVDYDSSNDCYFPPVDLEDRRILVRGGLEPSESNPYFHQQMVYAVTTETIRNFEKALGRPLRWAFDRNQPTDRPLRVLPHGVQEANAFYSRDMQALVFGYFAAARGETGTTLPGGTVFTCLSHDVIVHETTHALVDGLRRNFQEPTSHDTLAFHEALADIVALFQHFSFPEALLDTIQRSGGRIHRAQLPGQGADPLHAFEEAATNPLVALAKQFGEALGLRGALRSAIGEPPRPDALADTIQPHTRGAILVAAVFEAFFTVYARRTDDLFRIAGLAKAPLQPGTLPAELTARLAETASRVARQFLFICIRALDYCPPVDVTFGDYLRAMITADYELMPVDRFGYREAIIAAFRRRHIFPQDVRSLSEESLRWQPPAWVDDAPLCEGLSFDVVRRGRDARRDGNNARLLNRFADRHRAALRLAPDLPISVYSFESVSRVNAWGDSRFGYVAELIQTARRKLPSGRTVPIRGGVTLILEPDGHVRYSIHKELNDFTLPVREAFADAFLASTDQACYQGETKSKHYQIDFRVLHGGGR